MLARPAVVSGLHGSRPLGRWPWFPLSMAPRTLPEQQGSSATAYPRDASRVRQKGRPLSQGLLGQPAAVDPSSMPCVWIAIPNRFRCCSKPAHPEGSGIEQQATIRSG